MYIYIQNFLLKCWIKEGFKPPSVYFSLSVSHLGGRWGIPFTSCANDVTRRVKPQKVGEMLLLDRCHWKSEAWLRPAGRNALGFWHEIIKQCFSRLPWNQPFSLFFMDYRDFPGRVPCPWGSSGITQAVVARTHLFLSLPCFGDILDFLSLPDSVTLSAKR